MWGVRKKPNDLREQGNTYIQLYIYNKMTRGFVIVVGSGVTVVAGSDKVVGSDVTVEEADTTSFM